MGISKVEREILKTYLSCCNISSAFLSLIFLIFAAIRAFENTAGLNKTIQYEL
jgi:hypothetical protein